MALLPASDDAFSIEMLDDGPDDGLLFKIESFSKLSDEHKSKAFESENYKWIFTIDCSASKRDRICLHLSVAELDILPEGWEVKACCSIYLKNHILGNYLCFRGKEKQFNAKNSKWGFSISEEMLTKPSNGFLSKDNCIFGAEVFSTQIDSLQCLSVLEWDIPKPSMSEGVWTSQVFLVGGITWKLKVSGGKKGAIFLECVSLCAKVGADIWFCLRDKESPHAETSTTASYCFTKEDAVCEISSPKLFRDIFNPSKNGCFVEIEITLKGVKRCDAF